MARSTCLVCGHPRKRDKVVVELVWTGLDWLCPQCGWTRPGYFDVEGRPIDMEPIPERQVSKRDRSNDGWYERQTAPYRMAASSNSPHGRIRARVNRWREDAPGNDYMGQKRRWER